MKEYWYVLKVVSGKEKQLTEFLNEQISLGRYNFITRCICPSDKEFVTINKKKVLREKIIYNGYVYFETKKRLNEEEIKEASNLPNVSSMFGNKSPILLSHEDVKKIIKDDTLAERIESKQIKFKIGETVMINDGPFKSFKGDVTKINNDFVDVEIKIFSKPTLVSLNMEQILKII